ncbi:MAG: hypothetical protein A3G33_03635 [Omnitrophica bacterium RIFCSPLOWO2_12_FULL_44_17]|uniref:DUF1302 domain-containing protein n=1 Tax=Candidatus Danuiimicrobium aquiferis TaxID=1801832 RepID=A0A1G1L2C5_9BACT|nr:MAG: hypothetical protein A3B72_08855 [Omnitrophica bacterium RIFCSPHIGHO2_02_FULL_45_28]OGW91675.1 MAG: hypothetical protein A3E74_04615 [Omnitrophica bacterium RIFCSPHIGHO2_12_FULL_44_12]OGW99274.1 MAG: hypothetical protein A3G33_03635 [Omnitrophica bacterium RIFCSPLOWO2_12_FULL_44_17]OGX02641.1 MAG: hypothetical protein A3J12_09825 [Omnitrophica bacterium RIFCSPLOWO2_02_FULL_44_11]
MENNFLGKVCSFILIAFILAVSVSEVLFAEPASLDSEKIGNIPRDERKSPDAWAKVFDSVHGFIEAAYGPKFSGDKLTQKNDYNLLEQRLQLKVDYRPQKPAWLASWNPEFFYKGDLLSDEYKETLRYQIREVYGFVSPLSWMDVKLGRQILTWGTGDYLFINDVFPKDYESFFIGRDDEYLKAPSDAGKFSVFSRLVSMDVVVIPSFTPDVSIRGDRLSFYDNFLGRIAGEESSRIFTEPAVQPKNTEIATRLYRNLREYETAIYAFKGFFNQPVGIKNESTKEVFYPKLAVFGASIRGPVPSVGGIASGEIGYSDSLQDRSGENRLIENSGMKYLLGYERDFPKDWRIGTQYFVEQMLNFDEFKTNSQPGDIPRDEFRQLLTFRITKLFWLQTLEASLFTFYSPADIDAYIRSRLTWQANDRWKLTVGANIFFGKHDWTQFGQLEGNDNFYIRIRYSF